MFENCFSLKEIIGLENIQVIASKAFNGCSSLKEIKLSKKIKEIRDLN